MVGAPPTHAARMLPAPIGAGIQDTIQHTQICFYINTLPQRSISQWKVKDSWARVMNHWTLMTAGYIS